MAALPAWLTYDQVVAIHSRQLRRFGGQLGCAMTASCDQRSNADQQMALRTV